MRTEEPMTLRHILPNCRTIATGTGVFAEIPAGYAKMIPDSLPEELRQQVRRAIHGLCIKSGKSCQIFNEAEDRGLCSGYRVPIADWDFMANQPVPGWKWFTETKSD